MTKTSGRKVKCMTCGNLYRAGKGDHKGCPTCNGSMKETKKHVKRSANNR